MINFLLQGQMHGIIGHTASLSLGLEMVMAIFVASVLGSLHCVGMCGPFMALALGTKANSAPNHPEASLTSGTRRVNITSAPKWILQMAYHIGRLSTYLLLGLTASVVSSLLGVSLEHFDAPKWISVGGVAGLVILSIGVWRAVGSLPRVLVKNSPVPTFIEDPGIFQPPDRPLARSTAPSTGRHMHFGFQRWGQLLAKLRRRFQSNSPSLNAYLWGFFSTLLPCGWLYLFVIAAIASPSVWWAFLMMVAFWLGTLPALAVVSTIYTSAGNKFQWIQHPATTSVILGLGLYLMVSRTLEVPTLASTIQARNNVSSTVDHSMNETFDSSELSKMDSDKLSAEILFHFRQSLNSGLPHCGPWNPSLFPLPTHAN